MGNIVETVEDKIQKAILTAIDSNITSETELVFGSTNESSGQDATIVMVSSESGNHNGITAAFEKIAEK